MSESCYAVRLIESNYDAVKSEYPKFDLLELELWVEQHGEGYFVRDEGRDALDCTYMTDFVFHTIYAFDNFKEDDLFHRLIRKK